MKSMMLGMWVALMGATGCAHGPQADGRMFSVAVAGGEPARWDGAAPLAEVGAEGRLYTVEAQVVGGAGLGGAALLDMRVQDPPSFETFSDGERTIQLPLLAGGLVMRCAIRRGQTCRLAQDARLPLFTVEWARE